MKKFLGWLLLLCTMMVGTVSCEVIDPADDDFSEEQLIGKWATKQAYVGGEWLDIPSYSDMYATMTFYEDGSYYGDNELFGSGWGTYKLKGNKLKTYIDGELFYTYTIKSLTENSAEVTMSYEGAKIAFRLIRKY